MKNKSLTRNVSYWLLLILSVASTAIGGWLVWDNISTMQTTLLAGTATNIEVYVGQAWITTGAALLAAGIIGLLLALVLSSAKTLTRVAAPVDVEQVDWTATDPEPADSEPATDSANESESDEAEDQNGSSGSTAIARKISVK